MPRCHARTRPSHIARSRHGSWRACWDRPIGSGGACLARRACDAGSDGVSEWGVAGGRRNSRYVAPVRRVSSDSMPSQVSPEPSLTHRGAASSHTCPHVRLTGRQTHWGVPLHLPLCTIFLCLDSSHTMLEHRRAAIKRRYTAGGCPALTCPDWHTLGDAPPQVTDGWA